MNRLPALLLAASCVGFVVGACALLFVARQPTYAVARGEPVRQDDFRYTVVGVARSKTLGFGRNAVRAAGTFYIVSIRVDNDARRVPFRWDPSMAEVVDAGGRTYAFSVEAQQALALGETAAPAIDAGSSATVAVAFDLPAAVKHPALAYSNGILMGDLFDGGSYGRARIPLD